ncbi:TPA: hypothetical protein ACGOVD_000613 [Streptococcus suis]
MFKKFNKQFYRSLDFYCALCLLLFGISSLLDREFDWWFYLLPVLLPFTLYQAFFSSKSNLKQNWLIYLCLGLILIGFWLEFLA